MAKVRIHGQVDQEKIHKAAITFIKKVEQNKGGKKNA